MASVETVVVSGVSCRLPESDNVEEFVENLYGGVDMVTDGNPYWDPDAYGLPRRTGNLKSSDKFDASFFGVSPKQASLMDPQLRMLLETSYECIVDAGVNPASLRGSNTGVFLGVISSDAHDLLAADPQKIVGYEMTGCARSMIANRLSYFFDFRGPSYSMDTACSSGLLALNHALKAIQQGQCDCAIVGGANLLLHPSTSLQYFGLKMLSPDGTCKSFDASANGYVRSEAVVTMFLQRAPDAKRIYGRVLHSATNCDGYTEQGITYPSAVAQKELLLRAYKECDLDPSTLTYMEAHGTGTAAGDPQEVNTIAEVFCSKRERPLLIGSVKSNLGHTEGCSGLVGVLKILLAYKMGQLPANLHLKELNPSIPSLHDGRIKIVTKNTEWVPGLAGVSSFGFGGLNVHAILAPDDTPVGSVAMTMPYLFPLTGRTQAAVQKSIDLVEKNKSDLCLPALLSVRSARPPGPYRARGYYVAGAENTLHEVKEFSSDHTAPSVWYVFPGMGSQWHGMGRMMMKHSKVFKESIMRSHNALEPHDFNLYQLLTEGDQKDLESPKNSFVGITSIQIALLDALGDLGVEADGYVGHSVGELACAYADRTLTAEQTILAAYWRGRCIEEANLETGAMAALGMTWEEAKKRCPEGVVPACHNGPDSVTVSGPQEKIRSFVEKLKAEGVFAREVNTSGVAFHSYLLQQAAPALKNALQQIIPDAKIRSSKWISSSVPQKRWDDEISKYSSAEYHVNNFLNPVLFAEALEHIPQGAVVVEIGPHGLLNPVLRRSRKDLTSLISLMKRNHDNNYDFFLSNIGKCYIIGVELDYSKLQPEVQYPVSSSTPAVSPAVLWKHDHEWLVPKYTPNKGGVNICSVSLDPQNEYHYAKDHKIDGRILFPATGFIHLAWEALAKKTGSNLNQCPVTIRDFKIHRATVLTASESVDLQVEVTPHNGRFDILEDDTVVASGIISTGVTENQKRPVWVKTQRESSRDATDNEVVLLTDDVYKELRIRGYDYGPEFKDIVSLNSKATSGQVRWKNNWVTFLDGFLQIHAFLNPDRALRLPTEIEYVEINPLTHATSLKNTGNHIGYDVTRDETTHALKAGGVTMSGVHLTPAPRSHNQKPLLTEMTFVPYMEVVPCKSGMELENYKERCACAASKLLGKLYTTADNNIANGHANGSHRNDTNGNVKLSNSDKLIKEKEVLSGKESLVQLLESYSCKSTEQLTASAINLQELGTSLDTDCLLQRLKVPPRLKTYLDIVIENQPSFEIKLLHVQNPLPNMPSLKGCLTSIVSKSPVVTYSATYSTILCQSKLFPGVYSDASDKLLNLDSLPDWCKGHNVVVVSYLSLLTDDVQKVLSSLKEMVNEQGFILLHEITASEQMIKALGFINGRSATSLAKVQSLSLDAWQQLFLRAGLDTVAMHSDGLLSTLFLLRKKPQSALHPMLVVADEDKEFEWINRVKDKLSKLDNLTDRLWLIVPSNATSGMVGFVNSLKMEPKGEKLRSLITHDWNGGGLPAGLRAGEDLFDQLIDRDLVMNVYRGGEIGSFRHKMFNMLHTKESSSEVALNINERNDLKSLHWATIPGRDIGNHTDGFEKVSVYYSALNFRDIMLATGRLSPEAVPGGTSDANALLGLEFSGRDSNGNRVMGVTTGKALATTVYRPTSYLWKIPAGWTLEQAATIPMAYSTADYALMSRGKLLPGETILIQSGASSVGQAAIRIARARGCRVIVTVGTEDKAAFVEKELGVDSSDIFFSRSSQFVEDILRVTGGKGVDVVLNSLAGEKLMAGASLLKDGGRFLELGKYDLSQNSKLGMRLFLKNASFHGIVLEHLLHPGSRHWPEVWRRVQEGIQTGLVKPLQTTVYSSQEIESAFRKMSEGTHIGKILIQLREEEPSSILNKVLRNNRVKPRPVAIEAVKRTYFDPGKVYVITGGLGGLGLEVALWMVRRGARQLVMTSRSGVKNGYQSYTIQRMKDLGCTTTVMKYDVSDLKQTEELYRQVSKLGPMGGIFHLAAVLCDGLFTSQSKLNFQQVCSAKADGARHLDTISRRMPCIQLDYFVMFSSMASGIGNAGQTNYAYANSVLERICEQRRKDGLSGLAVQWGFIGDVGIVQDQLSGNDMYMLGIVPQRIPSFLITLDTFLQCGLTIIGSMVVTERRTNQLDAGDHVDPATEAVMAVLSVLGIESEADVKPERPLAEYGLDSLMTTEIRQVLGRKYSIQLTPAEVQRLTTVKLRQMIQKKVEKNDSG